jgi:histo-blood group ABO system transferase
VQGGRPAAYLAAVEAIAAAVDEDAARGITAVWHDESHWNRYLVDHPPDVELSPAYCTPEGSRMPFSHRILALTKDHAAMRA